MPKGLPTVVALLALGYLLMLLELFVPGGVIGVIGLLAAAYGCYLAFGLGTSWGAAALVLSVIVAFFSIRIFLRSRMARNLVLNETPDYWKAPDQELAALIGREGRTVSALRPAGIAQIGDDRIDVITDSEFLRAGVTIRVREVEGNRVVVEAVEQGSPTEHGTKTLLST